MLRRAWVHIFPLILTQTTHHVRFGLEGLNVEARFFSPPQTKSKTPEICQRPNAHQAQWSTAAENVKKKWLSAINQIQSPKKRNPAHSIHNLMSAREASEGSK